MINLYYQDKIKADVECPYCHKTMKVKFCVTCESDYEDSYYDPYLNDEKVLCENCSHLFKVSPEELEITIKDYRAGKIKEPNPIFKVGEKIFLKPLEGMVTIKEVMMVNNIGYLYTMSDGSKWYAGCTEIRNIYPKAKRLDNSQFLKM